jgi:peptide/nickel transport system permease protein
MLKYAIRRILSIIPTVIGISVIVFVSLQLAPGDPAQILLGKTATAENMAKLNAIWGFDKPLPVQYGRWALNAVQGNFGDSIIYKNSAISLVGEKLGATLILALTALFIAIVFGILLGIVAAVYKNRILDRLIMATSYVSISMPTFWIGIILIIFLSQSLNLLPSSGMYSAGKESFSQLLQHLIMPAFTLALIPLSIITRITRSSMTEILDQEYIKTARAKGCMSKRIIFIHALKNAFVPILSVLGMETGYIIGGTLVVESLFSWPGLGYFMLQSVAKRDYNVVLCGSMILCCVFVLINLAVDLLYGVFDPKIRYD